MNKRINRLRKLSYEAEPSISIERALHQTDFYEKNYGKHSIPVLRALSFYDHCQKKTLYMGGGELIVGERGPFPKAVPTFPELTCHSVEDLYILNNRKQIRKRGNSILARKNTTRANFRTCSTRMETSLRSRAVHRIYGTAGTRTYCLRWQNLQKRHERFQKRNSVSYKFFRLFERSRGYK